MQPGGSLKFGLVDICIAICVCFLSENDFAEMGTGDADDSPQEVRWL